MNLSLLIEKWLTRVTIVTFAFVGLSLLLMSRKPICLNTLVLDKIEMGSDSFIYRCGLAKRAPFSGFVFEHLEQIQSQILIEKYLLDLKPVQEKFQIKILPQNGSVYHWQGETLEVSQNLVLNEGLIEKSVVKHWLRSLNKNYFSNDLLGEEVFADFILATFHGRARKLEKPKSFSNIFKTELKPEFSKYWINQVKTVLGYCLSDYAVAEHLQMCANLSKSQMTVGQEIIEFSLIPLLDSIWISLYQSLPLKLQFEIVRAIPEMVTGLKIENNFYLDTLQSTKNNPWVGPYLIVQRMNQFWNQSFSFLSVPTYRNILALLAQEVEKRGFQKIINVREFDLVYISDTTLDAASPKIASLVELSKKNPNFRILLRDPEKVWFLPAKIPVSNLVMNQIRSHKVVLETCQRVDFNRVISFSNMTERLMVIRNCDLQKTHQLQAFVAQGAEGFALQNQKTSFVQFHLPSVMLRKEFLSKAGDVFRFVIQRPIESPSFQSLGWQAIDWNERLQTYHPKGYVDAIELFRISPLDNSNNISNL